jgi:hypothetical protein
MSTTNDVEDDYVIDCIDDEEVEEGNELTVLHSEDADDPTINSVPIVSHPASTESPAGVNNLNSPIVATRDVTNSELEEEQELLYPQLVSHMSI